MSKIFSKNGRIGEELYSNLRYDISSKKIKRLCEKYLNGLYAHGVSETLFSYIAGLLRTSGDKDLYDRYHEAVCVRARYFDGITSPDCRDEQFVVHCDMLRASGIPNQYVYCKGYDCSCRAEYENIKRFMEDNIALPSTDHAKLHIREIEQIGHFLASSRFYPANQEMYRLLDGLRDGLDEFPEGDFGSSVDSVRGIPSEAESGNEISNQAEKEMDADCGCLKDNDSDSLFVGVADDFWKVFDSFRRKLNEFEVSHRKF